MQAEQQVVVASSCFKLLGCSWGDWAGWPATRSIILYWQNICVFSGSGLVEITKLVLARPDFSSCWAGVRPGFLCVPLESFPFRLTGPVVRISKKKKYVRTLLLMDHTDVIIMHAYTPAIRSMGVFSWCKFLNSATVPLSFVFGNYCPIID